MHNFYQSNFLERIKKIQKLEPKNPFLQKLSTGFYTDLPHCFSSATFSSAKHHGVGEERIRLHLGKVEKIGSAYKALAIPQGYDFISLSNAWEQEDPKRVMQTIAMLFPLLSKGGVVVAKKGVHSPFSVRKAFSKWFEVSTSLNGKVRNSERSLWGSNEEFVVAQKKHDQLYQLKFESGYSVTPPPIPDYSKINA